MSTFEIDMQNLTIKPSDAEHGAEGQGTISSLESFAAVSADWPLARLVAIWNNIPGVIPVNRFTDRPTAVRRIWNVVQAIGSAEANPDCAVASRHGRRHPRKPLARPDSKKAAIIELLRQPKGGTLKQIMEITGWQAHSVRGFISGALVKKAQLKVTSSKRSDGERVYHLGRG